MFKKNQIIRGKSNLGGDGGSHNEKLSPGKLYLVLNYERSSSCECQNEGWVKVQDLIQGSLVRNDNPTKRDYFCAYRFEAI